MIDHDEVVSAGSAVVFRWKGGHLTGVVLHDIVPHTEMVRLRTSKAGFSVPREAIVRILEPEPYVYSPNGSKLRTKIVWYSNHAQFHGESWRVEVRGGSHGTHSLILPRWAYDVAVEHGITLSFKGYGHRQRLRQTAQEIVDKAIETNKYPFPLPELDEDR